MGRGASRESRWEQEGDREEHEVMSIRQNGLEQTGGSWAERPVDTSQLNEATATWDLKKAGTTEFRKSTFKRNIHFFPTSFLFRFIC